jgi:hypothetical protein
MRIYTFLFIFILGGICTVIFCIFLLLKALERLEAKVEEQKNEASIKARKAYEEYIENEQKNKEVLFKSLTQSL